MQKELFEVALDKLQSIGDDLVNNALEVTLETDDVVVRLYDLPRF